MRSAAGHKIRSVNPDSDGIPDTATATNYTYDANGSQISSTPYGQAATTYSYDVRNKLVGLAVGGVTQATYTYDDAGQRVVEANLATFTANAGTDLLTVTSGTYVNGIRVRVSNTGGALPGGLAAGTDYYVVQANGSSFKLLTTPGGAAIDITSNGTGTQTVTAWTYYLVDHANPSRWGGVCRPPLRARTLRTRRRKWARARAACAASGKKQGVPRGGWEGRWWGKAGGYRSARAVGRCGRMPGGRVTRTPGQDACHKRERPFATSHGRAARATKEDPSVRAPRAGCPCHKRGQRPFATSHGRAAHATKEDASVAGSTAGRPCYGGGGRCRTYVESTSGSFTAAFCRDIGSVVG